MGSNCDRTPRVTTAKVVAGSHTYYVHVERLGPFDAQLVINESADPHNRNPGHPTVLVEPDSIFDFIRGFHDALLQSGVLEPYELGWFDALEVRHRHEAQKQVKKGGRFRKAPKEHSKADRVYALERDKKRLEQSRGRVQASPLSSFFQRALRAVRSRLRKGIV